MQYRVGFFLLILVAWQTVTLLVKSYEIETFANSFQFPVHPDFNNFFLNG